LKPVLQIHRKRVETSTTKFTDKQDEQPRKKVHRKRVETELQIVPKTRYFLNSPTNNTSNTQKNVARVGSNNGPDHQKNLRGKTIDLDRDKQTDYAGQEQTMQTRKTNQPKPAKQRLN
jgi:hypothetical protein